MTKSNLAICYQGIQRTYRNAIVDYIRVRLRQSFPLDYLEKLKKPFEKEWESIAESAFERRQTGEIGGNIVDEFDLLGVNHFYNIFEAHFEHLCPSCLEANQKKKARQALLQWMKTIKNLRDPLSHPSEQDFGFEDSFILLDSARRVLSQLGLQKDAGLIKSLIDELSGGRPSITSEREPLEDRLPPRESIVVDFVGRQKELRNLWTWFEDPVTRRWALAGEGGKGKSALAYKFATDVKLAAPRLFQIVLWLSAKKRRFLEGTAVSIDTPDFADLDTALNKILTCYGWAEEVGAVTEIKKKRVLELIDTFPALMVVDDVDTLEGQDEDAIEFFSFVVPQTRTKVLFTSRRQVFGMGGTTTHIGGLEDQDAERFIFSRCRLMELDPSVLTKEVIREVIKVTESSPLYIEDLVRLFAIVTPREAIRAWKEKAGDEARQYALGRELDLLSDD